MKNKIAIGIIISLLSMVYGTNTYSQTKKFHAVFIFNFYKQMEWPTTYRNTDFVIAVVGESPIVPILQKLSSTKSASGNNKFIIKKVSSLNGISKCHMLFIPEKQSNLLNTAIKKFNGKPTLIITEKAGLGGGGSAINFVKVNNRLKFELNETTLKKANIQVSNVLKSLAILI